MQAWRQIYRAASRDWRSRHVRWPGRRRRRRHRAVGSGRRGRAPDHPRPLAGRAGRPRDASRTSPRLLFDGFFDDLPADLAAGAGRGPRRGVRRGRGAGHRPARPHPDRGDARADRPAGRRRRPGDRRCACWPRRPCSPPPWSAPRPARRRSRPTRRSATPPTSCACCAARRPTDAEADALDTYLVTVSDHGLNASTFAARVVASTRAGLTSAVLAGISALKGPLHGGAPGPVIDMLDEIGDARERPGLDRGGAGPRRPADGLRPPGLPGARSRAPTR